MHVEFVRAENKRENFIVIFSPLFLLCVVVPTTQAPTRPPTTQSCPSDCLECNDDNPPCCTNCREGFIIRSCGCFRKCLGYPCDIVAMSCYPLMKFLFLFCCCVWLCPSVEETTLAAAQVAGEVHLLGVCVVCVCVHCALLMETAWRLPLASAQGYAIREERRDLRLVCMVFVVVRTSSLSMQLMGCCQAVEVTLTYKLRPRSF